MIRNARTQPYAGFPMVVSSGAAIMPPSTVYAQRLVGSQQAVTGQTGSHKSVRELTGSHRAVHPMTGTQEGN